MPTLPWRIEGTLPLGEANPDVWVYFGDTFTNDTTGAVVLQQDHSKRMSVKLNDLTSFLTNPVYTAPAAPATPPPPTSEFLGTVVTGPEAAGKPAKK